MYQSVPSTRRLPRVGDEPAESRRTSQLAYGSTEEKPAFSRRQTQERSGEPIGDNDALMGLDRLLPVADQRVHRRQAVGA